MGNLIKNKSIGAIFLLASVVVGIVGMIRFLSWAPAHDSMDTSIVITLVLAIVLSGIVLFKDEDILVMIAAALYAYATARFLGNSVGSFVDAFQGVNLFGDATQVGTIIGIVEVMATGLVLLIISSFLKREKQ